jgi:hypothetical protein
VVTEILLEDVRGYPRCLKGLPMKFLSVEELESEVILLAMMSS